MTERPNVAVGDSWAPEHEIIRVKCGSNVHGMAIPGSDDIDEMGVYVEPLEYSLGLKQSVGHWTTRDVPEGVRSGPGDTDLTLYSLRHYMDLATQGNPTVLTVLYAPDDAILRATARGRALRVLAPSIVSQHAVTRHLGYLKDQYNRMRGIGPKQNRKPNRPELIERYGYDTKYASHAIRLGFQGLEMATEGKLTLPMTGIALDTAMRVKRGEADEEYARGVIERLMWILEQHINKPALHILPAEPNYDAVNRFMIQAQTLSYS